jgi:hypothetical protein
MANLMGFKRVSRMPSPKGRSIYDPLLDEVRKSGGIYALDTGDRKRAYSLSATIRAVIKKREYDNVVVSVVDTTVVVRKESK